MKKFYFNRSIGVLLYTLLATSLFAQGVKIGDNSTVQDPSAILELENENLGLLITRVSLTGATDNSTIPSPANSLLIYNRVMAGSGGDLVTPGFYYWDSGLGRWKGLMTSTGPAGDVWIDDNQNVLSINSEDQILDGSLNVAIGKGTFGDSGSPSNYVVAIGDSACGSDITSGNAYVVSIGYRTAYGNSGVYVNAIGQNAAQNNTGNNLNAFGSAAGESNHGGSVNVLGLQTGQFNSGGDVNAMGARAARNNDHGGVNAFGLEAAMDNQGADVHALGVGAARENTNSHVIAIGDSAAYSNEGWCVVALGMKAAALNTGAHSVAIGERALYGYNGDGEGNIAIGWNAANTLTSGTNNIAIGHGTSFMDDNGSNQINIGNSIIREEDGVITLNDVLRLPATTAPTSPVAGMIYFDGAMLYCWDGSVWQELW